MGWHSERLSWPILGICTFLPSSVISEDPIQLSSWFRWFSNLHLSLLFFKKKNIDWFERNIDLLSHLLMHSLVDTCMCPDWKLNPQPWWIKTTLWPAVPPLLLSSLWKCRATHHQLFECIMYSSLPTFSRLPIFTHEFWPSRLTLGIYLHFLYFSPTPPFRDRPGCISCAFIILESDLAYLWLLLIPPWCSSASACLAMLQ